MMFIRLFYSTLASFVMCSLALGEVVSNASDWYPADACEIRNDGTERTCPIIQANLAELQYLERVVVDLHVQYPGMLKVAVCSRGPKDYPAIRCTEQKTVSEISYGNNGNQSVVFYMKDLTGGDNMHNRRIRSTPEYAWVSVRGEIVNGWRNGTLVGYRAESRLPT